MIEVKPLQDSVLVRDGALFKPRATCPFCRRAIIAKDSFPPDKQVMMDHMCVEKESIVFFLDGFAYHGVGEYNYVESRERFGKGDDNEKKALPGD